MLCAKHSNYMTIENKGMPGCHSLQSGVNPEVVVPGNGTGMVCLVQQGLSAVLHK